MNVNGIGTTGYPAWREQERQKTVRRADSGRM